jgi:hypothetical protein
MFAEIGRNLLNFVQAVIALNNQFISTLLRVCCEAWRGTGIIVSGVIHGVVQIASSILDLGQEILQILYYFLAACYSLGVVLSQILYVILTGLENIGAFLAGVLLKVLRYGYDTFKAGALYLTAASSETRLHVRSNVAAGASVCKDCLDTVYVWACDAATLAVKQVAAVLLYLKDLPFVAYKTLGEKCTLAYEQMKYMALNFHECVLQCDFEEYLMWCISMLCVVFIIFLLKRYLSRNGLTFPPFVTACNNSSITHLRNDSEFDIFNFSDEEEMEEEEEEESEEEEGTERASDEAEETDESVEEYELATSDESEDSDDDENDENLINVQLPELTETTNAALRARATPFSDRSNTKMSQESLEKILERERDRRACVVCQDALKCVLVLPCRHMCLCIHCAHYLVSQRIRQRICPLCRTRIETIMNVYV